MFTFHQHGFWAGKSCTTQLLEVLKDRATSLDKGYSVDVIYLDFSKAVDKVSHRLLLHKLGSYGISESIIKWISSFLSNMSQRVVINGVESASANVTSGVLQGSVLGPTLFLMYVNDMPDIDTIIIVRG